MRKPAALILWPIFYLLTGCAGTSLSDVASPAETQRDPDYGQQAPPAPEWLATGTQGMVASDSQYASQAGLEILRAGGNAFDAAAAVSFALSVTRPQSTGLGGGGFLVARLGGDGTIIVQDFRESAPQAASPTMYTDAVQSDPSAPPPSVFGHQAVAVPGLVAGRAQMLERFGTCSLATVLAPAIRLAREGFPVDRAYVGACAEVLADYRKHPRLVDTCGYVYRVHLRQGNLRAPGEVLVQPALARLLEAIAASGPEVFYQGAVARAIGQEMAKHGGIVTAEDLARYRVIDNRQPVITTYRDYTLIGMPPPSSGGICLAETLNILETVDLPALWRQDRSAACHHVVEAMKHAFADRARWLGDDDFAPVPVKLLTSKVYARQLATAILPDKCHDVDTYGAVQIPDDAGTSHFCVVDRWGNCVASTETINTSFGSLAAVDEWGLILNNEMDDFAAEPDKVNVYGLVQSHRNAVAPGKRPLSSMTPTIVLRDGAPCMLLGGSGGPRIISSVLSVFLGLADYGLTPGEAMKARRPHHQWRPDQVFFDARPEEGLAEDLAARGHHLARRTRTGIVQAIVIDAGKLTGVSDPRKGGRPAGY